MHHVLSEVLCQPWCGPLAEALERSEFNEIQDVLLTNHTERDMLTFLDANDVVTPCHIPRRICSSISSSSAATVKEMARHHGLVKFSKAQYELCRSSSACYKAIEKVTILASSNSNLHKPAHATMPRNVTSSTMVTSTSMISLSSERQDVKNSGSIITVLQHVLHAIFCEAVDCPLVKALEQHGLMTVQDVLLLNQAERDALHSPKLMTLSVLCQLVTRTGCLQSSSLHSAVRMRASLFTTGGKLQGMNSITSDATCLTMLLRSLQFAKSQN